MEGWADQVTVAAATVIINAAAAAFVLKKTFRKRKRLWLGAQTSAREEYGAYKATVPQLIVDDENVNDTETTYLPGQEENPYYILEPPTDTHHCPLAGAENLPAMNNEPENNSSGAYAEISPYGVTTNNPGQQEANPQHQPDPNAIYAQVHKVSMKTKKPEASNALPEDKEPVYAASPSLPPKHTAVSDVTSVGDGQPVHNLPAATNGTEASNVEMVENDLYSSV